MPPPVSNFLGVGGGPAFNVNLDVQLEAEAAYDFKRNYTSTFSNGLTGETVNSNFRTLHGFFGPKFQPGSGAFRVFVTGKVGFDNFSINNQNPQTGFHQHSRLKSAEPMGRLISRFTRGEGWRLLLVRLVCGLKLATISTLTAAHTMTCELRLVRSCGSKSKRVWRLLWPPGFAFLEPEASF